MINEGSEVYRAQRAKEEQYMLQLDPKVMYGRYGMITDNEIRSMWQKELELWDDVRNTLKRIERRLSGDKIDEVEYNTLVKRVNELESTISSLRRVLSGDEYDDD